MTKKTILVHSNFCKAFTGFGKNKKNILRYLFDTDKYNVVEFANGRFWDDPEIQTTPWRCIGSLPSAETMSQMKDGNQQRVAAYGAYMIDQAIQEVKPDVYIGIEDIWAFDGYFEKPWWDKINTMIWTTLDSLPILTSAIDAAPKIKNYFVWASFAEKAFQEMGYDHVKTLRGSLDVSTFLRMSDDERKQLRSRYKLSDEFIVGFVFRNQLRKSVPNMLDGFKLFKVKVPEAKLLLHTHWAEGWDILKLLEEKQINQSDILTTYFCNKCKRFFVSPFAGQELNCKACHSEKSVNTTNISHGVDESQLNEIYNLMDVYCHPFTSGGQEIPVQEAKLTELVTLVTNYSCGEDYCNEDSGGLPLAWSEYREPGTQFIKASTCPKSIFDQLMRVYEMTSIERAAWGIKARQFVIDNCSVEQIGKQIEDMIDAMPVVDYNFSFDAIPKNPLYEPPPATNGTDFIIDLYKNMMNETVDKNSSCVKHWLREFEKGMSGQDLYNHFKNKCSEQTKKPIEFEEVLGKDDKGFRLAIVVPDSDVDLFLINGLLKNVKKQYPKHNIYIITRPHNFQYIEDNVNVYKCVEYSESIDNAFVLEGAGDFEGYFDLAFFPTSTTQKFISYIHNGKENIQFQLQ